MANMKLTVTVLFRKSTTQKYMYLFYETKKKSCTVATMYMKQASSEFVSALQRVLA